ncbi:MAG TPA: alpha/beta hydrolase [Thermoanaerobaculia bacterium]|nr:alpha/beta hydrolase [Thermoanaerobaculia bacterium]
MQRKLSFILAISILLLASSLAAQTYPPTPGTGTFTTTFDIEFANVEGISLKLDLHLPDDDGVSLRPAIIWLHSGAWITGDRTGGAAIRQARRGYAVASIDYRLAPKNIYPAQLEDCKAAVRWLRANAARYRLDPSRIGVFGSSAGGHLAALLGTTGGVAELEGLLEGNAGHSSRVQAVVDFYGPTDLLKLNDQKLPCYGLNGNDPGLPPSLLIGCPIQECKEKTDAANPIRYITPDDPPFLILHGTLDCLVPWQQSQILYDALKSAGVDATFHLLDGAQHGGAPFDDIKYKQAISDFLDRNLRPLSRTPRRRASRR